MNSNNITEGTKILLDYHIAYAVQWQSPFPATAHMDSSVYTRPRRHLVGLLVAHQDPSFHSCRDGSELPGD